MAPREDEKQKNSFHQCYIMKQEFVALALAIVFGTEWCILHTPHATDGNKQEVSRLFLHTKRDLKNPASHIFFSLPEALQTATEKFPAAETSFS